MGETHQQTTAPSRLGMKSRGGEIVEVEGGHIVRSTGRKDRHSKVCTAKGPRDRRVRLSALTAIQFYDVQDRLGYDRPSKAVDWLINKAKSAIDELAELPTWHPLTTTTSPQNPNTHHHHPQQMNEDTAAPSSSRRATSLAGNGGRISEPSMRNLHHQQLGENPNSASGFLPPSLDTDIADTMKSFFPTGATAETAPSSIQFENYPPDLLSRTSSSSNQNQDLRLSLQSFQDPILLHQHQAQTHHHHSDHVLFSGTTPLGFAAWSDQHHSEEQGRLQKMVAWNAGADAGNTSGHGGGGGGSGFIFNAPSPSPSPFIGQSQYLSQRGPLQSSNNPSIRAWIDPSITTATDTDHHHHHRHLRYLPPTIHQSSISGIGFASGGFSGFRIPARIQGEEEHDDGVSDKPSSASSDSRH